MAAGRLEVEIMARLDKLEAGLKKAEQSAKSTGSAIDKSMSTPTGKTALAMGKVLGSMAALELAAKGLNAGFQLTEGLTAAFAGNTAEAEDAFVKMGDIVKTLPAGIGPVAQAVEDLVMRFSQLDEVMSRNQQTAGLSIQRREMASQIRSKKESNDLLARELEIMKIQDPIAKRKAQLRLEETKIFKSLAREVDALSTLEEAGSQGLQFQLKREALVRLDMLKVEKAKLDLEEQALELNEKNLEADAKRLTMSKDMMEAKQALTKLEALEDAERTAAQSVNTASTAFGTFTFGRSISGSGAERRTALLSDIDGGIKTLINLVQIATRSIGFA